MKVSEHLNNSSRPHISFEILPPTKGTSVENLYQSLDPLMEFKPSYIDITCHQAEVSFYERDDGLLERRIIRKRPGTVAIASAIQNRYGVDVVPHLICDGFSREETEDALIDLNYLGIENILVVRGDPNPVSSRFIPQKNGYHHSIELLQQINNMNHGKYLDEALQNPHPTQFCTGVAGYPEKHVEAPNFSSDLHYLKQKVDAGASYIVTQMFFDNQKYFDFVKACRDIGIKVPVIPGLKAVSIKKHLNLLPQTFHVDLPEELSVEIEKCRNNECVRELGIEWALHQSRELFAGGVPGIHFFTMGRSDNIRKIIQQLF
ncbi:MAG: methylenetetrahydrofolate reductase [NAD(P)H] [Bacteroidales bacterium]|nr:methylenetetrahydrofolate reductase [NAD(P)H] [Bacteroidales bacterium]